MLRRRLLLGSTIDAGLFTLALIAAAACTSSEDGGESFTDASSSEAASEHDAAATDSPSDAPSDATSDGLVGLSYVAGQLGGTGHLDGTGEDARLFPGSIRVDSAHGALYLLEPSHIRRIDLASKTITTVAGHAIQANQPGTPYEVDGIGDAAGIGISALNGQTAFDATTNRFYFGGFQTIRALDVGTNRVSTISGAAGEGGFTDGPKDVARLFTPIGLVVDSSAQTLYFAGNTNLIRAVTLSDGSVATPWRMVNASNLAFGAASKTLFVQCDGVVRKVPLMGGTTVTLPGAPVQGDIAVDDTEQRLFFGNARAFGYVDLATNTQNTLYTFPQETHLAVSIALDEAHGKLYANADGIVQELDLTTSAATDLVGRRRSSGDIEGDADKVSFGTPTNVAFDAAGGRGFVTDATGSVRTVDLAAGHVTLLAGYPGARTFADGPRGTGGFHSPGALAYAPGSHTLYVADGPTLRAVDTTDGSLVTVAGNTSQPGTVDGPKIASRLGGAGGLAYGSDRNIYFTDSSFGPSGGGGMSVRKFDPSSNTVTTLTVVTTDGWQDGARTVAKFGRTPGGIAVDDTRNLFYVSDPSNYVIRSIDRTTGEVKTLAGTVAQQGHADGALGAALFSVPSSLILDAERDVLYVGDAFGVRIVELATGNTTTLFGDLERQGVRLGAFAQASTPAVGPSLALVGSGEFLLVSEDALLRAKR